MKKILAIIFILMLTGCYRNTDNDDIDITKTDIPLEQISSFISEIIEEIPNCTKEVYTGKITSIESVIRNCTSKTKKGIYPYDSTPEPIYKLFDGKVGISIGGYMIEEKTFYSDPYGASIIPKRSNKYLCKELNTGSDYTEYVLYVPLTGIDTLLINNKLVNSLDLYAYRLQSYLSDNYCEDQDPDCKNLYDQGIRVNGENYFIGGILSGSYVYLINDRFYYQGTGFEDNDNNSFSSRWNFAGIKDNNIIVKRAIKGNLYREFDTSEFTLITCEIPL